MIIERPIKKTANFMDIDIGECFIDCGRVYIKIDDLFDEDGEDGSCYNVIDLETGRPDAFGDRNIIEPMPTAKIIFTN